VEKLVRNKEVRVLLDPETKRKFEDKCWENRLTQSEAGRRLIEAWVRGEIKIQLGKED